MTMSRLEGRRELGGWGRNWVFTAAPETYNIMRSESIERDQRYADAVDLDDDEPEDEE